MTAGSEQRAVSSKRIGDKRMIRTVFVFFCLLPAVFLPAGSAAQQTAKIFRIGFLDNSTASGVAVIVDTFRPELRKLGWIEGKNLAIEYRFGEEKPGRLAERAAELVRPKVDLILVGSAAAALAAKRATATIPILMTNVGDPVGA